MFRIFLIGFLLFSLFSSAQHSLLGTFEPAEDFDFIIVYKVTPERWVYVVNGEVDSTGFLKLALGENASPGVYKAVYDLPEKAHAITFIYNGNEDVNFSFSKSEGVSFISGENKIFQEYSKKMHSVQSEIQQALVSDDAAEKLPKLIERQKQIQTAAESQAEAFTLKYIRALKPYIPDNFENKAAYEIYRKNNFFDNFDFSSEALQHSDFGLELLKRFYYEFVSLNNNEGYRAVIDDIVRETLAAGREYQKNILTDFWQFLYDNNRTNAANYLASKHLIRLARMQGDLPLAENLERIVNTSVGAVAPDFTLMHYDENKTLHELKDAAYYVLIFWSTECPHCTDQMPVIYEHLKDIPTSKIQVVTVALESDATRWQNFSKQFSNYINVLGTGAWRDEIVRTYDIQATPTFFVLGPQKQIFSRPRGVSNFLSIIETLKNHHSER